MQFYLNPVIGAFHSGFSKITVLYTTFCLIISLNKQLFLPILECRFTGRYAVNCIPLNTITAHRTFQYFSHKTHEIKYRNLHKKTLRRWSLTSNGTVVNRPSDVIIASGILGFLLALKYIFVLWLLGLTNRCFQQNLHKNYQTKR